MPYAEEIRFLPPRKGACASGVMISRWRWAGGGRDTCMQTSHDRLLRRTRAASADVGEAVYAYGRWRIERRASSHAAEMMRAITRASSRSQRRRRTARRLGLKIARGFAEDGDYPACRSRRRRRRGRRRRAVGRRRPRRCCPRNYGGVVCGARSGFGGDQNRQ